MSVLPDDPPPAYENSDDELSAAPAASPPTYYESDEHPLPTTRDEKATSITVDTKIAGSDGLKITGIAPPTMNSGFFKRNNLSRLPSPSKHKPEIVYDNCEVIFDAFLELENDANSLNRVSNLLRIKD